VVPAGARVLGQTKPVQTFGETRLAVSFTRLVMPDGRTYPLDHFLGLNAIGDAGLRDQVDQGIMNGRLGDDMVILQYQQQRAARWVGGRVRGQIVEQDPQEGRRRGRVRLA